MSIATKLRLSVAVAFGLLGALLYAGSSTDMIAGLEPFLVFGIVIVLSAYALSLRCGACGKLLLESIGSGPFGNPALAVLLNGTCPCGRDACQERRRRAESVDTDLDSQDHPGHP